MKGVANVTLIGNLTQDPEIRPYNDKGDLVANPRIAINTENQPLYLRATIFGNSLIEKVVRPGFRKGKLVMLMNGSIRNETYKRKENGVEVGPEIVVTSYTFGAASTVRIFSPRDDAEAGMDPQNPFGAGSPTH